MDQLCRLVDLAAEFGLDVMVDGVRGHLSSFDFYPEWTRGWHHRDVRTAPDSVETLDCGCDPLVWVLLVVDGFVLGRWDVAYLTVESAMAFISSASLTRTGAPRESSGWTSRKSME